MTELNRAALAAVSPDAILIDSRTLAGIIAMSPEWVVKNRARIIGAQKIGGRWRYNIDIIRDRLLRGKDIVPEALPRKPYRPRQK